MWLECDCPRYFRRIGCAVIRTTLLCFIKIAMLLEFYFLLYFFTVVRCFCSHLRLAAKTQCARQQYGISSGILSLQPLVVYLNGSDAMDLNEITYKIAVPGDSIEFTAFRSLTPSESCLTKGLNKISSTMPKFSYDDDCGPLSYDDTYFPCTGNPDVDTLSEPARSIHFSITNTSITISCVPLSFFYVYYDKHHKRFVRNNILSVGPGSRTEIINCPFKRRNKEGKFVFDFKMMVEDNNCRLRPFVFDVGTTLEEPYVRRGNFLVTSSTKFLKEKKRILASLLTADNSDKEVVSTTFTDVVRNVVIVCFIFVMLVIVLVIAERVILRYYN